MSVALLCLALGVSLTTRVCSTQNASGPPTIDQTIDGWTIRIEPALVREHPRLWGEVREELDIQLKNIVRVVPDSPLAKLRQVPIWIHIDTKTTCAAFHPNVGWLRDNHMDIRMVHCVEIGNARNFVSWSYEQPWMVMHELAHAYNYRFLPGGFDNRQIKAAWEKTMKARIYDSVLRWDGTHAKHYAETNQMEYFSEMTESYFGRNDFYPFVRAELMNYDPTSYALMQSIWGKPVCEFRKAGSDGRLSGSGKR